MKLLVCGRSFCASEVFIEAGWDAVAVEPNVYHEAGSLGDDDDACVCLHGDEFARRRLRGGVEDRCVSRRESDVGAQSRHQRDLQSLDRVKALKARS